MQCSKADWMQGRHDDTPVLSLLPCVCPSACACLWAGRSGACGRAVQPIQSGLSIRHLAAPAPALALTRFLGVRFPRFRPCLVTLPIVMGLEGEFFSSY